MSMYEPKDSIEQDVVNELAELMEMGLVEIVGINPDGHWLYAATDEGRKVLRNWPE